MSREEIDQVFRDALEGREPAALAYRTTDRSGPGSNSVWDEIDAAEDLLGQFPEAGVVIAQDSALTVRSLQLSRVPFYVWYLVDLRDGRRVTLFRLFHARQLTPEPRLP